MRLMHVHQNPLLLTFNTTTTTTTKNNNSNDLIYIAPFKRPKDASHDKLKEQKEKICKKQELKIKLSTFNAHKVFYISGKENICIFLSLCK